MKSIKISVQTRKNVGKKATSELRKQGHVPCVMYGGEENIHFHAHENDFRKIIYTPEVFLIELDIEGKTYKSVLKEIDFHPVTDKANHIDFVEVIEGKETIVNLPIRLTGTSEGILAGGKLRLKRRSLKVSGLIDQIPEDLEIDITSLQIGDSFKVKDLKYDNLELLDPSQSSVVGVATSRLAALDEDEVEGEEGDEEGTEEGATEEAAESNE